MGKEGSKKILAVPSVRRGNGSGHLHRMLHLAAEHPRRVSLFLDRTGKLTPGPTINLKPYEEFIRSEIDFRQLQKESWSYILLDQRETPVSLLAGLKELIPGTPVAAVDEGGKHRKSLEYLIDTLPSLRRQECNLFKPDLNPRPLRRSLYYNCPLKFEKVLISFGGEDPRGLTLPTLMALRKIPFLSRTSITVAAGPAFRELSLPSDIEILRAPGNLREYLSEYDCLITSYGLTALEALAAGIPVVTVNPSRYHSRLAKKTGLLVCGTGKPDAGRLKRALENPRKLIGRCALAEENLRDTADPDPSPAELSPSASVCPGCGAAPGTVLGRFPERTFYRCASCTLVYQQRWIPDSTVYNHAYFFDEYKRQYGKSYLDDFAHIRSMGRERLRNIRIENSDPSLLDVGCAYGPFLEAAREAGFRIEGLEPSKEAARWAEEHLGCRVSPMGLEEFVRKNPQKKWDAVTLWYVIEHFPDLESALQQLSGMVKPGGMLALGTPNGAGISARRNLKKFLAASPADHYTILSPKSVKRLLKQKGFRVEKMRIPGMHRERFPVLFRILWPFTAGIARLLRLGDTFEVYARRMDRERKDNSREG
ncbi:methyltransferase domain-containing protein [Marispirochaeta aestuarii]|uniref:methyltransferase domain-containing protein n=1 Tax=Marispirochaeta aestuarii TaxID=1963862 RepID=UPI0029C80478|nr:methyltransferase domain-containing protein [Marispirochaeta aestuarii]